jgi:hypothetical protein
MHSRRPIAVPLGTRLLPGPWPRAAVALMAGFFLAAQVAISVHTATVVHAVCPEHGELIHLAGHADADSALRAAADHRPAGLEPEAPVSGEHLHDICFVCTAQRAAMALTTPLALRWREVLVERAHAPPAYAAEIPPSPRYLFAPKQSPPV